MSATPTIAAPAIQAPDYVGLRAPRLPSGLSVPVATWNRRDLRATVTEGATVSVWSGSVRFVDGRPGQGVGYELVDVECESITPEGEPSEGARECAWDALEDVADEIGEAK